MLKHTSPIITDRFRADAKIDTYLHSEAESLQGVLSVRLRRLQRRNSLIFNPYHNMFSFVLAAIRVDRCEK